MPGRVLLVPAGSSGIRFRSPMSQTQVSSRYCLKRRTCGSQRSGARGSKRSTGNDRSITIRASAMDPTAPVATICIAMLPSAVASTGPAITVRPVASARKLIQQPVSRPAADDQELGDRLTDQFLQRVEHDAVLERKALEDRSGAGAGIRRHRLIGYRGSSQRWPRASSVGGGATGGRDRRARGTDRDAPPLAPAAWRSRESSPASAQLRRQACSSHKPAMFFSSRVVPPTPPSLVKFSARDRAVITGAGTSMPSSDHVPELRNASRARTPPRRPPRSRCRGTPGATTGVPLSAAEAFVDQRAEHGSGLDQRRQQPDAAGRAARADPVAQVALPRVDELCGRRVGELGGERAGQPRLKRSGWSPAPPRARSADGVAAHAAHELIQRVERQKLNAGDRIDLFGRHALRQTRAMTPSVRVSR